MARYRERYVYDAVGNFQEMIHRGSDPAHPGWTRAYAYDEASQLERGKRSNRLSSSTIGATTATYSSGGDGYDAHGNMLRMPQLHIMQWDFNDQLQMTQRQAVNADDAAGVQHQGERTWYVYDAAGQRVRKVTELANGAVKDERVYLGGFEIYRRHGNRSAGAGNAAHHGRQTAHRLGRDPHRGRRSGNTGAAHPLPVRQPPPIKQLGTGRNRRGDFVRGILSLRQHVVSGGAQPDGDSEAIPIHRQGAG